MDPSTSPADTAPVPASGQDERIEWSAIDASTRWPVIICLLAALAWLLVGTVLALIASFKLHTPGFLGDYQWLTYGRVNEVKRNALIYGWGTNAAFAVTFWLMARLSRARLRHGGVLIVATYFWNFGLLLGLVGILGGDSTAVPWLELPSYITPLLFIAYVMVAVWAVMMFRCRRSRHVYVSQWYLLAALFCFPWIYSIAQVMVIYDPARGTVQSVVDWWYVNNLIMLWFIPVGLAAAYYFIPKVLGKPIHSYYLAALGFWSLQIFGAWASPHHLIGGPVPAWLISAGVAASMMLLIPVVVTAINLHLTMVGSFRALRFSPTLRFVVFGGVNFTIASLIGVGMSLRSVSEVTHFTHFTQAHALEGMYGFFAMVMFGSIYYLLPRLVLKEWPSATLIRVHFWAAAIGSTLYWLALSFGGWIQGMQMNTPDIPFLEVVHNTLPWLFAGTVGWIILAIGHVAFAVNLVWLLCAERPAGVTAPTLFRAPPPMEVAPVK